MIKVNGSVIKAAILDMDGVLWRSQTPLCDLPELFANFDKHAISVILATNNGTNTITQYVDKLKGYGVIVDPASGCHFHHGGILSCEKTFP